MWGLAFGMSWTVVKLFLKQWWKVIAIGAAAIALASAPLWAVSRYIDSVENRGYQKATAEFREKERQEQEALKQKRTENIADATKRSNEVTTKENKIQGSSAKGRVSASKHLAQVRKEHEDGRYYYSNGAGAVPQSPATANYSHSGINLASSNLDRLSVWLLNDARQGFPSEQRGCIDAPASSDDSCRPPADSAAKELTEVTGPDLVDNDLEVVRMYNQLAIRHNGLVDWVETHITKPSQLTNQKDKNDTP